MNYKLRFEGFGIDEDLREKLMHCVREFVLRIGPDHPLQVAVKQVDGLVQSRVELILSTRKISALVRRKDPVSATQAAIDALGEVLNEEPALGIACSA
jgi:hypothetical protein